MNPVTAIAAGRTAVQLAASLGTGRIILGIAKTFVADPRLHHKVMTTVAAFAVTGVVSDQIDASIGRQYDQAVEMGQKVHAVITDHTETPETKS